MEFYEPRSNVQLNGVTRIDPDAQSLNGPSVDRHGFVGQHKQAS